ncbi:histidinol-phosphate transaminase [Burkholderia sp. L27(2015)]|uniref:histidinol-phosphate transaminase n=1 Tax=Burkholderia sp. L27(2015) TaxID=1641858 RepID=UPI00131C7F57|nr:histidinol-phosphate transaminase [Burkholderia sp. L27(2015)]
MSDFLPYCPPHVQKIPPYVAGRPISDVVREFGLQRGDVVKLASNENPLGMPGKSRLAISAALAEGNQYPDANGFELKAALSDHYAIDAGCITLGNGSHDILEMIARAVLQPGQSALYSQYSFVVYSTATQACGAEYIVVPADASMGHDLDAMAAAIRADTRLVYIANPNNPTGHFLSGEKVLAFIERVPSQVVVVLDEAYTEYLEPADRYDSLRWIDRFPNLLVTRTFSKAFGLAGLRVGFGVASPALTGLINRVRQVFNVNALAQVAAAAALGDAVFLARSREVNRNGYAQLTNAFDAMKLSYVPSWGNFVMVRVGRDDGAGARVNAALMKRGIIVRPLGSYDLPCWLRITIGLPDENARLIAALQALSLNG